jgi:hypothetical protein
MELVAVCEGHEVSELGLEGKQAGQTLSIEIVKVEYRVQTTKFG